MTQNAHTPGPWRTVSAGGQAPREPDRPAYVGPAGQGGLIAFVYEKAAPGEADANARLVAAAPAMLSALEAVARSHLADDGDGDAPQAHPADRELIRLVREALDLAKGA